MPQASRSYVQPAPTEGRSSNAPQTHHDTCSGEYHTGRRNSLAPVPPPRNPARRYSNLQPVDEPHSIANDRQYFPSSASAYGYGTSAPLGRLSTQTQGLSQAYDESPFQHSPAMTDSPFPSRPPTPPAGPARTGFEPPSFLNPDLLTILPTISAADSAKLLEAPSPTTESGRSKRYSPSYAASIKRASSALGGINGSRYALSEAGGGAEGRDNDRVSRRAKSVMGHRGFDHDSRWEGSSYGEGVLMQSDGLSEPVKGFSSVSPRTVGWPKLTIRAEVLCCLQVHTSRLIRPRARTRSMPRFWVCLTRPWHLLPWLRRRIGWP